MSGPAPAFTTIGRYRPSYDQAYGHLAQAQRMSNLNQRPASSTAATTFSSRPVSRPGSSAYGADDEKEFPARAADKARKEKKRKERRVAFLPLKMQRAWTWREKKGIPHSQQQEAFASWCERNGGPP